MATDIVGPVNAPNTVTARPSDTRTGFGATDTWFKDCTSPSANDGTRVMSGWLNAIIGQLRNSIRGNGNTGGGSAVVTEDNSDNMLLRAIQYLIQRGQPQFALDTSTSANIVTAPLSPVKSRINMG